MSAEAQAQERARTYFASKSVLTPAEVREQVVAGLDSLDAVLAGLSPDRAGLRAWPDEWSVAEVVDHLIETHRPAVDELRCLLAGQRPPGEPIQATLQSKAPRLRPWSWLLDEMRRVHRDVVELLGAVPAGFETEARVSTLMVVNVTGADGSIRSVRWIEELDWKAYALVFGRLHAIDHMKQVRKVRAALP